MLRKKLYGDKVLKPSLPCRNKFLAPVLKKYAKTDIKGFWLCWTFVDFIIFLKLFCTRFSVETNANSKLAPDPSNFQFFDIFNKFNVFLETLQEKLSNTELWGTSKFRSVVKASFGMLDLEIWLFQKLALKRYRLCLVAAFLIGHLNLSQNILRNLNHFKEFSTVSIHHK